MDDINFLVNRKILKFQLLYITFGANVDKEKLLSIQGEKNVVCVCYIECVEVIHASLKV